MLTMMGSSALLTREARPGSARSGKGRPPKPALGRLPLQGEPLSREALLTLQRLAGNEAVTGIIQPSLDDGTATAERLHSDRFSSSTKLEACFEDKDRLGPGDPDSDAVIRLQAALIDVEAKTGNHYDLGPSGADGDYGPKTAAAVQKFKRDENLGSTQFADVGPGTMHRLDELFSAGGDQPPGPEDTGPIITDGPPGEPVGPTPPEPDPPEPLPAYEPGNEELSAPAGLAFADLSVQPDGFDPFTVQTQTASSAPSSELRNAIEQAVKQGIVASFESKYKAIFAELRGRIAGFFDRLKAAVKNTVRAGVRLLVNALAFALGGPIGIGVVSIFRKVWSVISGWFGGKDDDPEQWLADRVSRSITIYLDRLKKLSDDAVLAEQETFQNLRPLQQIKGTVADVEAFIRGIGRNSILANVRRVFGGFSTILRDLRETLKRFGFQLSDIPGLGQVDNVVQALDHALDPSVSPDNT